AFPIEGDITNRRAPLLRGRYSASPLIRTHPPPSRRRSISRLSRLYDLPCSGDFSPGRGRLLQLLGMSLSPCCRFHPAEVMVPCRSDFGTPCCLHPTVAVSALGDSHRARPRLYQFRPRLLSDQSRLAFIGAREGRAGNADVIWTRRQRMRLQ